MSAVFPVPRKDYPLKRICLALQYQRAPWAPWNGLSEQNSIQTPTDTYLSRLPQEIIDKIYHFAVAFDQPVTQNVWFRYEFGGIGLDFRFFRYSANYETMAPYLLRRALEVNTFTFTPVAIQASDMSKLHAIFSTHQPYFDHIRYLRIRLRSPNTNWPTHDQILRQLHHLLPTTLLSGFLHRFRRLERLEFEHTMCKRPYVDHQRDIAEGLVVEPARPVLLNALARTDVKIATNTVSGKPNVWVVTDKIDKFPAHTQREYAEFLDMLTGFITVAINRYTDDPKSDSLPRTWSHTYAGIQPLMLDSDGIYRRRRR